MSRGSRCSPAPPRSSLPVGYLAGEPLAGPPEWWVETLGGFAADGFDTLVFWPVVAEPAQAKHDLLVSLTASLAFSIACALAVFLFSQRLLAVFNQAYPAIAGNDLRIDVGMVFSVEPGIYLPNEFGVRIEDIVAVQAGGAERLNNASREIVLVS